MPTRVISAGGVPTTVANMDESMVKRIRSQRPQHQNSVA